MKVLHGTKLKKLNFNLQKKGDIYSFEGPLLSHFKDERGFDYLMKWVDLDEKVNRWQLFMVGNEDLNKYFSRKVNLRELIFLNEIEVVFFIDIDSDAEYKNIWIVSMEKIPLDYLPDDESYFEAKHANKYALELAKENKEFLISSKDYGF